MDTTLATLTTVISRRRWPAIAVFISVLCGAIGYIATTPRLYESHVRLLVDNEPATSTTDLGRNVARQDVMAESKPIAIQAELAASNRVLGRAVSLLSQRQGQEKSEGKEITIGELKGGLSTVIVPSTNILQINFKSRNPQLSAAAADAIAEAMLQDNSGTIRSEVQSARRFLEAEVPLKRQQLAQAEAAIAQFKRSQGLVSVSFVDSKGETREATQTAELIRSLEELQRRERELKAQVHASQMRTDVLKRVTNSTNLRNSYEAVRAGHDEELRNLRTKLSDLELELTRNRTRLTDSNPTVVRLLKDRDAARALYTKRVSSIVGRSLSDKQGAGVGSDGVSQDIITRYITSEAESSALARELTSVQQSRTALSAYMQQLPAKEKAFSELTRRRTEISTTLDLLQRKLDEARIAEAQLVSNFRIIDAAEIPGAPSWPKTPAIMVLATVAGILFAIGIILLLELLDGTLHHVDDVEKLVQLPVLGVLPSLPTAAIDLESPEHFLNNPALVESYRSLLKSIEFRVLDDLQVLVVSSTVSGEGKSVVAAHLAVVAAMLSRRVLMIDADLRRPTQHKLFNVETQPGLTDVITGQVNLADAVQHTGIGNLSVLTSGKAEVYPSRLFESKGLQNLLKQVTHYYDLVIVDTPPVTACVDAITLSRTLGSDTGRMLLVARPHVTQKEILMRAISELTNHRTGILGVAINGITPHQTDSYYRYMLEGYQPLNSGSTVA
jgi:capsular exopolysaccharide synthesis family protein